MTVLFIRISCWITWFHLVIHNFCSKARFVLQTPFFCYFVRWNLLSSSTEYPGFFALFSVSVSDWKVAMPHFSNRFVHPPQEPFHQSPRSLKVVIDADTLTQASNEDNWFHLTAIGLAKTCSNAKLRLLELTRKVMPKPWVFGWVSNVHTPLSLSSRGIYIFCNRRCLNIFTARIYSTA